ncbi:neurogenic locus notch homolog protein 1 isoform X1 [Anguilla rostrata]|uniref:neurogenic locus notch homolog protein 1 isoform X1 n=1 Tax=Anguilla rostrata TaxID=7938 RepID=UPI0030D17A99
MLLALTAALLLSCWRWLGEAAVPSDPWAQCPSAKTCKAKFADGICDKKCSEPECLRDGFDCLVKNTCDPHYKQYCQDHYGNSYCEQGCDSAPCGWDGSDCFNQQSPLWANGTLILHTNIPSQEVPSRNRSLLWALSILLRTALKLRGVAPFHSSHNLYDLDPQKLAELLTQASTHDTNGSLLYLQVDNRPCSRLPSTCFQFSTEAANFLRTLMTLQHTIYPPFPEIQAVIAIRGVREELGEREKYTVGENVNTSPSWLWAMVGVATGLGLALAILAALLIRRARRRRESQEEGQRVQHRSTATDSGHRGQAWAQHTPHRGERMRVEKENGNKGIGIKKKKKGKENGKRRREPLGEDAIRLRPLKKELDIGSDTDMTQSSMEDINVRSSHRQDKSICDHRPEEQKHFHVTPSSPQSPTQASPGGWERNTSPPNHRTHNNTAPVQWCGPDGSVVLIRAVRSGLDRVVLELLRAGVPVNNTDHTGRSALHWACSVNHLSLARTLIRYGAAVDLQDYKGETALFLSALHGCYDTARFLLLNGANQDLTDCRGRRPLEAAREGLHHHVLELLLAHRSHRGHVSMEPVNDMLCEDRTFSYSAWVGPPGLPGRSASFSGVIGHREALPLYPSDWSGGKERCASPQNWRPQPLQSVTALVSPRILGRPSRPISTLQEVTSEAEEEDTERSQEAARAATPNFLSPQPAPRQRSFSCTQHALQRQSSGVQFEHPVASPGKPTNEHVEMVVSGPVAEAPIQSEVKPASDLPSMVQSDSEAGSSRNSKQEPQGDKISKALAESETSAHTAL